MTHIASRWAVAGLIACLAVGCEQRRPPVKGVNPAGPAWDSAAFEKRLAELTKLLDAEAALVEKAEDQKLSPDARLDAAEAALAAGGPVDEHVEALKTELESAVRTKTIDPAQLGRIRPTLTRELERSVGLGARVKAAAEQASADRKKAKNNQ